MKRILPYLVLFFLSIIFVSCGKKVEENQQENTLAQQTEYSPNKDAEIQQYNLQHKEGLRGNRNPCDTLSLISYILSHYPQGSYLVDFDKTLTFNVPKPAVIYLNKNGNIYILAVIARSKPGERLIEPKNIVGYDQSFIDLDSTKLGTAFFYLTLFQCNGNDFQEIWEAPIPNHGGFNNMKMMTWNYNGTPYIKVDFLYARGIGHIDYNYFFINGLTKYPHLLMTYKTIDAERDLANVNNDKYPDYYEHIFYNLKDRIFSKDSVAFIWDTKDSVYVNTRNHRQTQPY